MIQTYTILFIFAIKKMETKFKNEYLKKVVELAKKEGIKVYTFVNPKGKNNKIGMIFLVNKKGEVGMIQDLFGALYFFSMYKNGHEPRKLQIGSESRNPKDFGKCFSINDHYKKATHYESWADYLRINRIFKFYEV